MRIHHLVLLLAAGVLLAGCETVKTVVSYTPIPQRSDLFQLSNDAQLAYEAGEDAKAEQLYMALARATPNDPEIWLRLGNLYARANRPDAAADAYQRALSFNSSDARVWYNLDIIRLRQGWAAMIQAQAYLDEKNPLYAETDQLITNLGRLSGVAAAAKPEAPPRKGEAKK